MTVDFGFEIDQRVITPFGKNGIVSMCGVDDNRQKTYFIKTDTGGDWFAERFLGMPKAE